MKIVYGILVLCALKMIVEVKGTYNFTNLWRKSIKIGSCKKSGISLSGMNINKIHGKSVNKMLNKFIIRKKKNADKFANNYCNSKRILNLAMSSLQEKGKDSVTCQTKGRKINIKIACLQEIGSIYQTMVAKMPVANDCGDSPNVLAINKNDEDRIKSKAQDYVCALLSKKNHRQLDNTCQRRRKKQKGQKSSGA